MKRAAGVVVAAVLATAFVFGLERVLVALERAKGGPLMEGWQWQKRRTS